MPRVALVVGHNFQKPGYFSEILGESEYFFWSAFTEEWGEYIGVDVFKHDIMGGYTQRQRETAILTADYDLVFELHFNAAESSQANGCEAYYYFNNQTSKTLAALFCELFSNVSGIKNRGEKPLYNKNQNGFGFVNETKGHAILLEPFFASNEIDCSYFYEDEFATTLKEVIKYFVDKY